jgi:hypothetical protein
MSQVMMILLQDGLQQPSGAIDKASYYPLIYCRVPNEWIEGEIIESKDLWIKGPVLSEKKREKLLETLYGPAWRNGNSDGSQYVVLEMGMRLLNPDRESVRPWLSEEIGDRNICFFYYIAQEEGYFQCVFPSSL